MKINNIKINAYGNIENKEIELKKGINLIYGKNEAGKSTLLSYLVNIFYGISKNKEGKNISEFEKYKPWNNESFSGKIGYTLDDGKTYEVYRDFLKKNPKIYNDRAEDISDQFNIDKKDGNQFFIEQTAVDKKTYLSTVVSMQQEVKLDNKMQNNLVQKIANLAGTGEDNVSYKKAETKLQDKIRDEVGTSKTTQKPINIINSKLESIKQEISRLKPYENIKYELGEKQKKLREAIAKETMKKEIAVEIKKIQDRYNLEKEKDKINNKIKNDNINKLRELEESENDLKLKLENVENSIQLLNKEKERIEKDKVKQENTKNTNKGRSKLLYIIILLVGLVILAVNIILLKINVIYLISILVIALSIIAYIIKIKNEKGINQEKTKGKSDSTNKEIEELELEETKENADKNKIENSIAMIIGQKELLNNNNNSLEEQIKRISSKINIELEENYKIIRQKYENSINDTDIENMLQSKNITNEIAILDERINNKRIELNKFEVEENTIIPQLENMVELEENKEQLEEEYENLKNKENEINIAIENLKEAYEEMKTNITPKFTQNLSNNVSKISDNKYSKVIINDEKGLIIETQKGEYIEAEKLSVGTIDQLYFSLRLSMISELSAEKLPIILDETFAYFDDERLQNTIKYIVNDLYDNQIIILTCTDREQKNLDKLKIKYNLIEL